ncbi:MAG: CDP-alcohol phosphatidyltransferase family protein [Clostridiales bacterium]|nr:CDP-alcohol phosphatidyltransferase family protein [Clostridiales bacterium]
MIDTKLRKKVQPFFDTIAKGFVKLKIRPNTITLLAFVIGIISAIFIGLEWMMLALILLWISGLFDVLDGTVARITGKSSSVGAYMDLILDRMVEATVILGFYHAYPEHTLMYLLFFVAVLFNFTTFIVAGALFKNEGNKSMYYDVGIAERTETFIVFSLMMLLTSYIYWILLAFNAIVFLTGFIRFYRVLKYTKE